jgi:hypothetical protein
MNVGRSMYCIGSFYFRCDLVRDKGMWAARDGKGGLLGPLFHHVCASLAQHSMFTVQVHIHSACLMFFLCFFLEKIKCSYPSLKDVYARLD